MPCYAVVTQITPRYNSTKTKAPTSSQYQHPPGWGYYLSPPVLWVRKWNCSIFGFLPSKSCTTLRDGDVYKWQNKTKHAAVKGHSLWGVEQKKTASGSHGIWLCCKIACVLRPRRNNVPPNVDGTKQHHDKKNASRFSNQCIPWTV